MLSPFNARAPVLGIPSPLSWSGVHTDEGSRAWKAVPLEDGRKRAYQAINTLTVEA